MAQDPNIDERIDNYLLGRLSQEERESFEQEMAANTELAEEVAEQKKLMGAVIQFRKQELKDYIREHTIDEEKKRNAGPMWMSIAAAVVLAVGSGIFVYVKQQRTQTDQASATAVLTPQTETAKRKADSIAPESKSKALAENTNAPKQDSKVPELKDKSDAGDDLSNGNTVGQAGPKKEELAKPKMDTVKIKSDWSFGDNAPVQQSAGSMDVQGTYQWSSKDEVKLAPPNVVTRKGASKRLKSNVETSRSTPSKANNTDTISGDVLVAEKMLDVESIATKKETDKSSGGYYEKTQNTVQLSTSYYTSPLNFQGYKYYHKQLYLYGVDENADVKILSLNNNYYLKLDQGIFRLTDHDYTHDFSKPVKDKKTLKELNGE